MASVGISQWTHCDSLLTLKRVPLSCRSPHRAKCQESLSSCIPISGIQIQNWWSWSRRRRFVNCVALRWLPVRISHQFQYFSVSVLACTINILRDCLDRGECCAIQFNSISQSSSHRKLDEADNPVLSLLWLIVNGILIVALSEVCYNSVIGIFLPIVLFECMIAY